MSRDFDNSNDQCLWSTGPGTPTKPITMVAWVYIDTSANMHAFSWCDFSATDGAPNLRLKLTSSNRSVSAIEMDDSATEYSADSSTFIWAYFTWHFIAAVFISASSRKVYIDGSIFSDTATAGTQTLSNADRMLIGGSGESGFFTQQFSGRIAEAAVYGADLTDQLDELYAGYSPLQVQPQSLIVYCPLIGRADPEVDLVGGNSFTLEDSPIAAAHPPILYEPSTQLSPFTPGGTPPASSGSKSPSLIMGL
jgi:hypothetical protein